MESLQNRAYNRKLYNNTHITQQDINQQKSIIFAQQ
jgi:ribosomal protein S11